MLTWKQVAISASAQMAAGLSYWWLVAPGHTDHYVATIAVSYAVGWLLKDWMLQ